MWDGNGAMKVKRYFKSWRYQEPGKGRSFDGNPSMHLRTFALQSINLYTLAPLNTGLSYHYFQGIAKSKIFHTFTHLTSLN
jgi:hypothetical protein